LKFAFAICVALAFGASGPSPAFADPLEVPPAAESANAPASRYANLSNEDAFEELDRRGIEYVRVEEAAGVRAPIRLRGNLHGVFVHSSLPVPERDTTPFEILDARLALALDDFAQVLANHDVVELVHFTMYRPNDDRTEENSAVQTRHPGGMAIDVGALKKRDGTLLSVESHWPAAIGAKTCGEGARKLVSRRGRELMSLVCEAKDLRLFHVILTPHFNRAHHDHFHLEVKPETKWFLMH
jgi:hypothetical protein